MRSLQVGLCVGLLATLVGCEGSFEVGDCDRDDAGRCIPLFPDDDAGGLGGMDSGFDGGMGNDGATPPDATTSDSSIVQDAAAPFDGGMDASANDAAAPMALTPQQFCDAQYAVARAWQARFDDLNCDCLSQDDRDGYRSFLAGSQLYNEETIAGCLTNVERLRTAGVTFDGTKAASCATIYARQFKGPEQFMAPVASCPGGFDVAKLEAEVGHGRQALAQFAECRATFPGTKAQNAACASTFECAAGLSCRAVPGGGATSCQPPRAANESCLKNDDCAGGHICSVNVPASGGTAAQSTCIAVSQLKAQTSNCATSSECIEGLICDGSTKKCVVPPADRICD